MPETVSTRYLAALADHGVESIFVNAGTDFAPIVEAYATHREEGGPTLPTPVVCTHENLAAGMAHGAALVTGRPQALMLHVSVGTANAVCATINAARDGVPLLVTAGRSPILESGAVGVRDLPIHWGQELYDQAGMLREVVKWDYELRDARQVEEVVDRALSVATAHPRGPVYLSLPREVLGEPAPEPRPDVRHMPVPAGVHPDPAAIEALAERIAAARFPVIVTSANGVEQSSVAALTDCVERFGIAVVDQWARYLNIPMNHPNRITTDVIGVFQQADVVVFLENDVPWIPKWTTPPADTFIAQVGVDPLYTAYPIRSHRSDLTISATPTAFLTALSEALARRDGEIDAARGERVRAAAAESRGSIEELRRTEAERGAGEPITKATISAALGELLENDDILFNEYVGYPELLGCTEPGSYYFLPAAGGLGWGLPAALGAKYAAPARTVIALLGDGAYMFANPAACHHAAAKHGLGLLTIVANDSNWTAVDSSTYLVYPGGRAATLAEDRFSDLSPSPDLAAYCTASGGYGVTVTDRSELAGVLKEALDVVRTEGRQALVDVRCVA